MMTVISDSALYVHVPFCTSICAYCDFARRVYQKDTAQQWLQAVRIETKAYCKDKHFITAYIGGGTPTAVDADLLDRLLDLLDPFVKDAAEYTIEATPVSLTQDKAAILRKHGINRVSLGYETDDEELLNTCMRRQTDEDVRNAVDYLKEQGIDNYSFDLLYSLPGQTMTSFRKSVMDAIAYDPKHLSLYSLTIEPGSVFGKKNLKPLDQDAEADMYDWLCRTLPEYGYEQYEISNFSKPGYASKHNQMYWHYQDFTGIGWGASGKEGSARYSHEGTLSAYLKDPLKRRITMLPLLDQEFEFLMMGLRLKTGVSVSVYQKCFGESIDTVYGRKINGLIGRSLLALDGDRLYVTDRGYPLLNDVLVELMPEGLLLE